MATVIYSFKVDGDGQVRTGHIFFGQTEASCRTAQLHHANADSDYGEAWRAGKTIEHVVEIEEIPDATEEDLAAFCGLDEAEPDPEE